MCGRFALISDGATLAAAFAVDAAFLFDGTFAPRYNIAPSQPVLAIRRTDAGGKALPAPEACHLSWGLVPSWSKTLNNSRRPINARAETVAEKPSFRAAYRRRRCLVPADGYYEWVTRDGAKHPHYIYRADHTCFAIAGLWEYWEQDGNALETLALLTCAANEQIAAVHHRMPVIIAPDDYALWLGDADGAAVAHLLEPLAPGVLDLHRVSKQVNSPANDNVECVRPADAAAL